MNSVRNGALTAITAAYAIIGETIYKHLGKLSEKDKSMIDERIKRLPGSSMTNEPKAASPKAAPSRPKVEELRKMTTKKEFSLDLEKMELVNFGSSSGIDMSLGASSILSLSSSADLLSSKKAADPLDFAFSQLSIGDALNGIEAMRQIERIMSSPGFDFKTRVDDIVTNCTLQIRLSFTTSDLSDSAVLRLCKHLINALIQVFGSPEHASSLGKAALSQCVQELLFRLLDPKLNSVENGSSISKALNVLMVRILENSNRNDSFR